MKSFAVVLFLICITRSVFPINARFIINGDSFYTIDSVEDYEKRHIFQKYEQGDFESDDEFRFRVEVSRAQDEIFGNAEFMYELPVTVEYDRKSQTVFIEPLGDDSMITSMFGFGAWGFTGRVSPWVDGVRQENIDSMTMDGIDIDLISYSYNEDYCVDIFDDRYFDSETSNEYYFVYERGYVKAKSCLEKARILKDAEKNLVFRFHGVRCRAANAYRLIRDSRSGVYERAIMSAVVIDLIDTSDGRTVAKYCPKFYCEGAVVAAHGRGCKVVTGKKRIEVSEYFDIVKHGVKEIDLLLPTMNRISEVYRKNVRGE